MTEITANKKENNMSETTTKIITEPCSVFASVTRNGGPIGSQNQNRKFTVTGVKIWPGQDVNSWDAANPFAISNENLFVGYNGTYPVEIMQTFAGVSVSFVKENANINSNDLNSGTATTKVFHLGNAEGNGVWAEFININVTAEEKYWLKFDIADAATEASFDTAHTIAVEIRSSASSVITRHVWGVLYIDGFGRANFTWQ